MARLGVLGEIITRILNHATPSGVTNAHYNHYDYITEKRAALETWGARVLAIMAQEAAPCRHIREQRDTA